MLDSVIKVHEKVMGEDEQLMKNKALLDSLSKHNPAIKDSINSYVAKVTLADSAMDTWMHNFNPDLTGKTHEQIVTYLSGQKRLVIKVDSQVNAARITSDRFLEKFATK